MKKWILLSLCLLIAQLSISQNKYPCKQIHNGDTLIVLTPVQLAITNSIIEERNQLKHLSLHLDSLILQQKRMILLQNQEIENWKKVNDINKQLLVNYEQKTEELRKQNKRHVWVVGGICVSIGFVAGICVFAFK